MPADESLTDESPIGGAPEKLDSLGAVGRVTSPGAASGEAAYSEPQSAAARLDKMTRLLKAHGMRFPNNKVAKFSRHALVQGAAFLHAEGEWSAENGKERRGGGGVGPQFDPVTA